MSQKCIEAAFPNAQIQHCIIHQIRSSTRFVSYKHIKELMADLKKVYQVISEEEAMNNLIIFKDKWGKTYPSCAKCYSRTACITFCGQE
ncbi:transposase [uncultured Ruminococcus sp.]|uniref:transposase n=1 Tax=uncultured Ruminococcus sp. TaxID=165186 RepID=UPI00345DF40A